LFTPFAKSEDVALQPVRRAVAVNLKDQITKRYHFDRIQVLENCSERFKLGNDCCSTSKPREKNNGIKNPIHITTQDKQRLEDLLVEVQASDPRKHGDLKALTQELRRAIIVDPKDVFCDVITMNSRAEMRDLESGETDAPSQSLANLRR
jgi:Rnk N-terminus